MHNGQTLLIQGRFILAGKELLLMFVLIKINMYGYCVSILALTFRLVSNFSFLHAGLIKRALE